MSVRPGAKKSKEKFSRANIPAVNGYAGDDGLRAALQQLTIHGGCGLCDPDRFHI
jgi:hypothetical protein